MSPVAKNCDTDVRVHQQRFSDGMVRTQITALATLPTRSEYVRVEIDSETPYIAVEFGQMFGWRHTLPWSSVFPHPPTLGEMIEAAEALARGEWHKLFPEEV